MVCCGVVWDTVQRKLNADEGEVKVKGDVVENVQAALKKKAMKIRAKHWRNYNIANSMWSGVDKKGDTSVHFSWVDQVACYVPLSNLLMFPLLVCTYVVVVFPFLKHRIFASGFLFKYVSFTDCIMFPTWQHWPGKWLSRREQGHIRCSPNGLLCSLYWLFHVPCTWWCLVCTIREQRNIWET